MQPWLIFNICLLKSLAVEKNTSSNQIFPPNNLSNESAKTANENAAIISIKPTTTPPLPHFGAATANATLEMTIADNAAKTTADNEAEEVPIEVDLAVDVVAGDTKAIADRAEDRAIAVKIMIADHRQAKKEDAAAKAIADKNIADCRVEEDENMVDYKADDPCVEYNEENAFNMHNAGREDGEDNPAYNVGGDAANDAVVSPSNVDDQAYSMQDNAAVVNDADNEDNGNAANAKKAANKDNTANVDKPSNVDEIIVSIKKQKPRKLMVELNNATYRNPETIPIKGMMFTCIGKVCKAMFKLTHWPSSNYALSTINPHTCGAIFPSRANILTLFDGLLDGSIKKFNWRYQAPITKDYCGFASR